MSYNNPGNYPGNYRPFGPPNQPPGQQNQHSRYPYWYSPRNQYPVYPPNVPPSPPFMEYSLWGNSHFKQEIKSDIFNITPRQSFPPPSPFQNNENLVPMTQLSSKDHMQNLQRDCGGQSPFSIGKANEYPSRPLGTIDEHTTTCYTQQNTKDQHRSQYSLGRPEDAPRTSTPSGYAVEPATPLNPMPGASVTPQSMLRPEDAWKLYIPNEIDTLKPVISITEPMDPPISGPEQAVAPRTIMLLEPEPSEELVKEGSVTEPVAVEEEKVVIERDALYRHPDNFGYEDDGDGDNNSDVELVDTDRISNASGSTSSSFKRAGSAYPYAGRPPRAVSGRGRRVNVMQTRLFRALSQPARMEKGASMMHRMGWAGGGLGKDGAGIVEPITPNACYATTTVGFGQEVAAIQRMPSKRQNRSPCVKKQRIKVLNKENFNTNVLLYVLEFVRNDLMVELYFDTKLSSGERKRIHRLIQTVQGEDEGIVLTAQQNIVQDILSRNKYKLCTESEGLGNMRKICIFKEAPDHMFLVTPYDCRPCVTDLKEVEEESNPFLKSITKLIKEPADPQSGPPYLLDKLIEFFIDFCNDEVYTEFRFLGPFTPQEIDVMSSFFTLIRDLARRSKPDCDVPLELLAAFDNGPRYTTELDPNGFTSIKKVQDNLQQENEQLETEICERLK